MRAVRFARSGDPSVLRVEEVPDPAAPTGDRILVRVAASSVNGTDLGLRGGLPGAALFGRVQGLGFDLAGVVEACGPQVTAFCPGDRVAALLAHSGAARRSSWCWGRAGPRGCPRRCPRSTRPRYRWPG